MTVIKLTTSAKYNTMKAAKQEQDEAIYDERQKIQARLTEKKPPKEDKEVRRIIKPKVKLTNKDIMNVRKEGEKAAEKAKKEGEKAKK